MPIHLTAVVLAAGASQRMGEANKLLLPFRGQPLLAHVVDAAAPAADELVVVLGHEAGQVREVLDGRAVRIVVNPAHAEGMGTSVRCGVKAASTATDGFMICLSDLPLIEPSEYRMLRAAFETALDADPEAIVRPVFEGRPGHPVLFAKAHRPALAAERGTSGAKDVLRRQRGHVVEVAMPTDHVVHDVDTPEAYARLTGDATNARRTT